MAYVNLGGRHGHEYREQSRKDRRMPHKQPSKKSKKLNPHQYPLSILFYGRREWYCSLLERLKLNDKISYTPTGEIPDELGSIDLIVVDCIQKEDIPAVKDFLGLIADTHFKGRIGLSYDKGVNINELMEHAHAKFHYPKTRTIENYLNQIRKSKYAAN